MRTRSLLLLGIMLSSSCRFGDDAADGGADGFDSGEMATDASQPVDAAVEEDGAAPDAAGPPSLRGVVRTSEGAAIEGARVTLVRAGTFLDELRTGASGEFSFGELEPGDYVIGASFLRREYVESAIRIDGEVTEEIVLGPETNRGRWSIIGDTEPEYPAGTPSATLMPDGRIMYCHDTLDPVVVDPRTGAKSYPPESQSSQGCHMATVLSNGKILFVGGQDPADPGAFTNGIRYVKTYDPARDEWEVLPELNEPRWYPTLVRLADERMLACGGGQPPNAQRTDTCEIFDPNTRLWTPTGSMMNPSEYSPSVLLLTGEVLTTWFPPQLFDPDNGTWRPTGSFVQGERLWPGHAPHSVVMLTDGSVLAIGLNREAGVSMVERYDATAELWSLGATPDSMRSGSEVVLLPDGRVLSAGGKLEEDDPSVTTNAYGQVALTDLYDPEIDTWRSMSPMAIAREYHAMTLLVPDGRVVTTSGGGNQASGAAPENSVEAFEPPYLFRGPRPVIEDLASTDLARGSPFTARFSRTRSPTAVVLIGTSAVTHWMDGGVPRLVEMPFTVAGDQLTGTVPNDPILLPVGYYILFLMVDDIPSEGRIVRVP